ncbi:MAG TPA: diguanylate cyclase, partial [Micromonosporaceae bacterium]|nr:diguanylate cyclase [Micromonosporaceae bacterium]
MGEDWTAGGRPPAWFFERALAAVDRAVLAVDTAGRIRYWNGAAERLFGYSGAEALGRAAGELTGADVRLRDSSGREFPAHVVSTPIVADGGEVLGALAFARDLTEVERTRVALATSERRFRAMFEHAQLPQVTADLDGRLVAVNPALRALLGDHPAAAPGARVADLLHPTDDQTATGRVEAILRGGRDADTWEGVLAAVDGSAVPVSVHVALLREADGTPCGLAAFAQDLRGQRAAERELSRRALRDDLTGLANRTLLNDRLQHALARAERRRRGGVAVLFVDLDQFKMVNDSWGHAAGDRLLVQVADRLSATVRHGDTVARFGGDKFVVVCDDADAHRAQEVAGRLLSALAAPFTVDGQRAYVRASVGIALSPPDTPTELLSAAESAMYDAKARGRGRMQIFDAAVAAETTDRMTLSNDLRESLEPGPPPADGERRAGGLALHYQPVVDLATGRILGVEALARWNHATRGHVSPAAFVDVAESTGLAPALGRWAVDRARRDTDTLRSALGSPLRI